MSKIVLVQEKIDILPFHKALSWERFQALCTDVLFKRYSNADSREFLSKGDKQQGIDVYAFQTGDKKMSVAQCKLVESLHPHQVLKIIDEFLKGTLVTDTKEFILCTSADLGKQKDEKIIAEARKKLAIHQIDLIVWDERGLSVELRNHETSDYVSTVYHYFNADIALAFYGEVWKQHVSRLTTVEKKPYEFSDDYIERSVISYNEQLSNANRNFWDIGLEKEKETLISLIEKSESKQSRKIVLLSTAGFGKTEEIDQAAGYFSHKDKLIYPVRFYLRDYEGQDIEAIIEKYYPDWRQIPPENLLLLFDGLDEISAHHFQAYINLVNTFIQFNPKVQVINSSRYNFYDIRTSPLQDFEVYLLNPLTRLDIEKYINEKLQTHAAEFTNHLHEKHFEEYSQNPYYLTRLVRFYDDKKIPFPKSRTELFERILFERLEKDENRSRIPELKERLFPVAKQIAFCMTVAGKSALTADEIKDIVSDHETLQLLSHFSILNKNSASMGTWAFEHKNLQEYLSASVFVSLPFNKVLNLISFDFNRNKLNPKLLNTVSFLFELLKNDSESFRELFRWIVNNEPEVLVRFEKEQLSKASRFEVFKQILLIYKEKGIPIRASSHFSNEELAKFVEIDGDVIEFLIREIQNTSNDDSIYDALNILSYCSRPYRYTDRLSSFLFSILKNSDYPHFIKAKAIDLFIIFSFTKKDVFEKILSSGIDLTAFEIRKACIFFLDNVPYYETYSDFIIHSISILENAEKRAGASIPYYILKPLLLKFKSPQMVKKLFQYFNIDKRSIDWHGSSREFVFELNEIQLLLTNAADAYKAVPSILPVVYRLLCNLEHISYEANWLKPFKAFFENTCGTEIIFLKFYRYDKRQRNIIAFADELCCLFLIDEYLQGNLTKEELRAYRNVLSHNNWNLFIFLYNRIKHLEDGFFEIDDLFVDYGPLREKQKEKNQLMLLDRNLFFEEAEQVFDIVAKDEMTYNDFWHPTDTDLRRFQGSLVLEELRDLCVHDDDKIISKEDFYQAYSNDKKWQGFVIETTVDMVEDKQEPIVDEKLLLNLREWCKSRIENIHFADTVKDVDDTYTYNGHAEYVKKVFLLMDISLEDRLLLKMLPSDTYSFFSWKDDSEKTLSSKVVKEVKDKSLLRETVINNIRQLNLAVPVLSSHFTICSKLRYIECLPDLYNTITTHPLIKDYNRITLTNYYTDLGGSIQDFASYLTVPEMESKEEYFTSWQWFLIEELLFIEREKVTAILLKIITDETQVPNHLKAVEHLIQLGRMEGLRFWANYVKTNGTFPFEHRWSSLQQYLLKLPTKETIDIFISVFEFTYTNGLYKKRDNVYHIQDILQNSLITLAGKSFDDFEIIKSELSRMITVYKECDFVKALIYFSERLTSSYYETAKDDVNIIKAISLYQSTIPIKNETIHV